MPLLLGCDGLSYRLEWLGSCPWLTFDMLLCVKVDCHLLHCPQDRIVDLLNSLHNLATVLQDAAVSGKTMVLLERGSQGMPLTAAHVNQHDPLRLGLGFFDEPSKVVYARQRKVILRLLHALEEPSHPSGIGCHKLKVANPGIPVRKRAGDGAQALVLIAAILLKEGRRVCEGCHVVPATYVSASAKSGAM